MLFFQQVGQAKDEVLTNQLIDYLMGESDGLPKVLNCRHAPMFSISSVSLDSIFSSGLDYQIDSGSCPMPVYLGLRPAGEIGIHF